MRKNLSIKEHLDLDIALFHPKLCYPGEWMIGTNNLSIYTDSLRINSIEDEYDKFMDKYYTQPLTKILNVGGPLVEVPRIYLAVDKKTGKREAYFSIFNLILHIANALLLIEDDEYKEYIRECQLFKITSDNIQKLRDIIRNETIKYRDIIDNGINSKYYEKAVEMFKEYNKQNPHNRLNDLREFYIHYKEKMLDIRLGLRNIEQFFSKPIKTDELINCFNYDVFSLLTAYYAYEASYYCEKETDKPHYSMNYMVNYVEALKLIRKENPSYNLKVKVFKQDDTDELITVEPDTVVKLFDEVMKRHPDSMKIDLEDEYVSVLLKMHGHENIDLSTIEGATILSDIVKKMNKDKELAANWDFIPNTENSDIRREYRGRKRKNNIDYELRESYVEKCKEYLDKTPFIYKIYGKGHFEGYIGYIYGNNNVILEKFYENIKTGRVSNGNATYVMKLNTFLQNSKYNKIELISKICSGEITDVCRVFHRIENFESWKQNISQFINGYEYTEDVVNYIDSLLNDNIIDKNTKKTKVITKK